MSTFVERLEDGWHVIGCIGLARMHSTSGTTVAARVRDVLC